MAAFVFRPSSKQLRAAYMALSLSLISSQEPCEVGEGDKKDWLMSPQQVRWLCGDLNLLQGKIYLGV